MLQVTDIFTENPKTECLDWDIDQKWGEPQGLYLKTITQVLRSCGVSFDMWEQHNADGKAGGQHD